jgi:hypothetical protein
MGPLLREIRRTPLLWMLAFVPVVLVAAEAVPAAHTLLFVLASVHLRNIRHDTLHGPARSTRIHVMPPA